MTLPARPDPRPPESLRLVADAPSRASEHVSASLALWSVLFGALCLSAGHGIFLVAALTQLEKLPSRREIGAGGLELAVVGWFVAAGPLALACAALRTRLTALGIRALGALAATVALASASAFFLYLRAIALDA